MTCSLQNLELQECTSVSDAFSMDSSCPVWGTLITYTQ